MFTAILQVSNFAGRGPARVGTYQGIGRFGTYDAAGNVREWCLNASGHQRYILGGAWDDPKYLYSLPDARFPSDRSVGNGFRCVKYLHAPPDRLTAPFSALLFGAEPPRVVPASDEVYRLYKGFHAYDRGNLDARIEATSDASRFWREERVSFRAAYGDERVTACLFLPKNAKPPFQTVVTFPGVYAFDFKSSAQLEVQWFDFLIRSGRAVLHPIYKGTYERSLGGGYEEYVMQPGLWRELGLQWYKDLGRSIDYLESRQDIDSRRLAYHGISVGAAHGPRLMALEPRLKAGLLFWGGLPYLTLNEIDPVHFAPRCTTPTLMVNGRWDPIFPDAICQAPMFRLLGAPASDKRRIVVEDAGHVAINHEVIREALAWLDKYLGPVPDR
jgi:cephalosporin-C deacetylase-like acetyl esterase